MNFFKKLDGLETCTKMKHLHLYDNKISDCTQISNLLELELLWLNNNQITSLQVKCLEAFDFE